MTKWGARWQAFRFPIDPEKQELAACPLGVFA